MDGPGLDRPQDAQPTAGGMEQRHGAHTHLARCEPDPLEAEAGVVGQPPVVELGPFRRTGRARGVLDLDQVVRAHIGECGRVGRGQEVVPLGEQDRLAQPRDFGPDLIEECRHGTAELGHEEDPCRPRLVQDERQLRRPVGGVDRHQDQSGERSTELEDHPLGDVRRPHRDPLAGREPRRQRSELRARTVRGARRRSNGAATRVPACRPPGPPAPAPPPPPSAARRRRSSPPRSRSAPMANGTRSDPPSPPRLYEC